MVFLNVSFSIKLTKSGLLFLWMYRWYKKIYKKKVVLKDFTENSK